MLSERLELIQNAKHIREGQAVEIAGQEGEDEVLEQLLASLKSSPYMQIYSSMRVPRHDQNNKYEIDLVIQLSKTILAIEVKNWKGRVSKNEDGTWTQDYPRSGNKTYEDPVELLKKKCQALRHYLKQNDCDLKGFRIKPLVVFMGSSLEFAPGVWNGQYMSMGDDLHARLKKIEGAIASKRPDTGFYWLRPTQWQKAKQFRASLFAVSEQLATLPTWDSVALHGGHTLKGDLVGDIPVLKSNAKSKPHRSKAHSLFFQIPRSFITGWFTSCRVRFQNMHTGQWSSLPIDPYDRVQLRLAGRRKIAQISAYEIERIDFGYADHSYFDSIRRADKLFNEGQVLTGQVTAIETFGVFVSLDPIHDGLIHHSRISEKKGTKAYKVGDKLAVRIIKIRQADHSEKVLIDLEPE